MSAWTLSVNLVRPLLDNLEDMGLAATVAPVALVAPAAPMVVVSSLLTEGHFLVRPLVYNPEDMELAATMAPVAPVVVVSSLLTEGHGKQSVD